MPILMFCLLGILHTQEGVVRSPPVSGPGFEAASGEANVGHPTEVFGRALYNFRVERMSGVPRFACHD